MLLYRLPLTRVPISMTGIILQDFASTCTVIVWYECMPMQLLLHVAFAVLSMAWSALVCTCAG